MSTSRRACRLLEACWERGSSRYAPPAFALYRAGDFDFCVINYHAPSQESTVSTAGEVWKLGALLGRLHEVLDNERDLILAGDFNLEEPEFCFKGSCDFTALVHEPTTLGGPCFDNIYIDDCHTGDEYTGEVIVDRRPIELDLSDHAFVMAVFRTDLADDD